MSIEIRPIKPFFEGNCIPSNHCKGPLVITPHDAVSFVSKVQGMTLDATVLFDGSSIEIKPFSQVTVFGLITVKVLK